MVHQWVNQVTFLGSQHIKPEIVDLFAVEENLAVGICPGKKKGMSKKQDGNEDSLAVFSSQHGAKLLLLADSHFGAKAGELCVQRFHEQGVETNIQPEKALFIRHMEMETMIEAAQSENASIRRSATTLFSALQDKNELFWASTGDSYFYLWRENQLFSISQRHPSLFLGEAGSQPWRFFKLFEDQIASFQDLEDQELIEFLFELSSVSKAVVAKTMKPDEIEEAYQRLQRFGKGSLPFEFKDLQTPWSPLNIQVANFLPEWGKLRLQKGDLIFAATDGIEAATSGVDLEDLISILTKKQPKLEFKLQELFAACMGRQGGLDNLAMLLLRLDS